MEDATVSVEETVGTVTRTLPLPTSPSESVTRTVTVSHTVNGTNGWNTNAPVTVNVTTADTGTSGLAGAPTCTVDGSAATVSGSGPYSVSVAGNGTHPVVCSVSDNAGNTGSGSDSVKIDTVNPSGSINNRWLR